MEKDSSKIKMSPYIKKAIQEINSELKVRNLRSRVSVIDFTHFTNLHDNNYLLRFLIFGESKYVDILDAEKKKYQSYALFEKEEIKIFCNLGNNSAVINTDDKSERNRTEEEVINSSAPFIPDQWHQTLMKAKFGGCSIIYARRTGNDQSAVYLILSNTIEEEENGRSIDFNKELLKEEYDQKPLIEKIFKVLDKVLINELAGNLHTIWEKTELEKQKIILKESVRDLIYRKLLHSQKQHLALLSFLARAIAEKENKEAAEIIEDTQKSLSEFLDINRYISNPAEFTKKQTNLITDLKKLIHVFEIITSDKKILEEGIRLREHQYDPIVKASLGKGLFGGNFNDVSIRPVLLPVGIPKLIFKEIIVNAIQHSKWDEPNVEIYIEDLEDEITFTFTNSVMSEMIDKLNETVSNNNHGRDLIESLSEELGWSVFYKGLKDELKVRCSVHIKK